ncbi:uncharacterized protein LOC5508870 [Nematostella vectensis]|uniref:uncharacterized protein LOC5508870 n=1 Tax=Nematostella vectensis TaxID=45351 RepID=UPI0020772611|nr:uncharacterized protein LOC5508870 [Nematostella vectensis]
MIARKVMRKSQNVSPIFVRLLSSWQARDNIFKNTPSRPAECRFFITSSPFFSVEKKSSQVNRRLIPPYDTHHAIVQQLSQDAQLEKTDPSVHHFAMIERLHDLEERYRVRGYSLLRWGLGLVVMGVISLYLFREELRENVADEVADVASRSLGDENVVNKANEVTKQVLQDIINDPETTRLASNFVMSVLGQDDVRKSAVELTLFVLQNRETQAKVSEVAAQTLKDLINHPEMREIFLEYIKRLLLDESTKDVCKDLLQGVINDPVVKKFMEESFGDLVASSVVRNKAVELGKTVTHEVVSDIEIQKETGDALWTVVKKTVTPSWFSTEE